MRGVDADTGLRTSGEAHLRQSVRDILTTPLGSRIMRRTYGSRLFKLVDAPLNAGTIAAIVAASAEPLDRWEPRFRLLRVRVAAATAGGRVSLDLDGERLPEGTPVTIDGVVV